MKFLVQMFGTIRSLVFCTRVTPKVRELFLFLPQKKH